ncbi:MAG: 4-hydroxythreonine-4-phosphate dehydrogenase PdxA [Ignavibacteriae bacterium]|nr:4-hydroxythreonine-4-phosphate dehydrogenase PdxA [Ignavibacteriota bacterium]
MKKRILITCGDANGIGPELGLKLFRVKELTEKFEMKIIGPEKIFGFYSKRLKIKAIPDTQILNLTYHGNFEPKPSETNETAGRIAGDAVKLGVDLCMKNYFDALVTLPLNKKSLNLAGYNYRGHTEMLAHLTSSKNTFMMMYSKNLKIVPLTIHIPLKKVPVSISKSTIMDLVISVNNNLVKTFKIRKPKIAILSLNPHSGDGGIIGGEEKKIIFPAVKLLSGMGFNINGPFSSDGFFGSEMNKKFDVVIAMYHDQAMIPFKILSGDKGVNYTGGLKIIRTSPAHGTAFDIAGRGNADVTSSVEAVKLAGFLAEKN